MPSNECGRILWEGDTPYAVCTQQRHSVHSHVEFGPWESIHQGVARPFDLGDYRGRETELLLHAFNSR